MLIEKLLTVLGSEYSAKEIDGVGGIYRKLDNGFEFDAYSTNKGKTWTLDVWQTSPHRELMGIYTGIKTEYLKDALGHFAFLYRKLEDQVRVEREGLTR